MHPARFPYQKPPRGTLLNKSHPLAKGLVGAWLFNEGTGSFAFDSSGHKNDITLIGRFGIPCDWESSDKGVALYSDRDDVGLDAGNNINVNDYDAFTAVTFFLMETLPTSGGSYDPWIFNAWDTRDDTENSWVFAPYYSSGVSKLRLLTSSGNVESTVNLSADEWILAACGWDGSNNWVRNVGKEARQTSSASKPISHQATGLFLNGAYSTWRYSILGYQLFAYIYDRNLTDAELDWLYREPYAMFKGRRIFVPSGPVTRTVTTDLDAILFTPSVTYTVDTDLDSILKAIDQLQITDLDSQLFKKFDVSANLDSVLRKVFELTTDLDSVLLKSQLIQTQIDSILRRTLTQETTLDGILAGRGFQVNFFDSILQLITEIQTDLDAILGQTSTVATNLDAFLLEGGTIATVFDAVIQRVNREIFVALDAILEIKGELTTNFDAIISKSISIDTDLDAILYGLVEQTTNLDSKLYKIGVTHRTWLHALLQVTSILQVNLDANLVAALNTRFCYIDGVLLDLDRELSISLDAILGESLKYPHECFVAEGRDYFKAEKRESFIALPDTCKDRRRAV